MRRGFTLIELLVVIAILAAMTGVSVISFSAGRGAFRLKGAARDVFAAIRQARSIALVTQKPCIITYGEVSRGDTVCAQVTLAGMELMNDTGPRTAWTLSGEPVVVGGDEEFPPAEANDADAPAPSGGHTVAEALFPSISEEVLEGVRIKVVSGEENLPLSEGETEMRRARTSIYSNVDYLLEKYKKARAAEKSADEAANEEPGEADAAQKKTSAPTAGQEAASFVWQVNGRCEPHRVYVYAAGSEPQDGLVIVVDRFGAAKVLAGDEEGRE
ncbi:MAG TPA: hypothetical protein DER26_05320 [Verrucomicrobia bacterium]|nr:hypothetical protein [Verrucomicrobiota bacterium]